MTLQVRARLAARIRGFYAILDADDRMKPDKLARVMNEGMDDMPEIRTVLLTSRNARWADWIAKRLDTPGTVFIAVGAGHLAGRDSVQALLKAKKLKAVRIN